MAAAIKVINAINSGVQPKSQKIYGNVQDWHDNLKKTWALEAKQKREKSRANRIKIRALRSRRSSAFFEEGNETIG